MRKIVSILLLLVFLFNTIGYKAFFFYLEQKADARIQAKIQTLDEMDWGGWLVIERSRDAKEPTNVKKNFSANTAYVKSIFQNNSSH